MFGRVEGITTSLASKNIEHIIGSLSLYGSSDTQTGAITTWRPSSEVSDGNWYGRRGATWDGSGVDLTINSIRTNKTDVGFVWDRYLRNDDASADIILKSQTATLGAVDERIQTPDDLDFTVGPGEVVHLIHDTTTGYWHVVGHVAKPPIPFDPDTILTAPDEIGEVLIDVDGNVLVSL